MFITFGQVATCNKILILLFLFLIEDSFQFSLQKVLNHLQVVQCRRVFSGHCSFSFCFGFALLLL